VTTGMSATTASAPKPKTVLLLQGGGALGSYQAGVFEALDAAQMRPDWIAGISIGAINGALIAGNAPEVAVERLRDFWMLMSSSITPFPIFEEWIEHAWNQVAASNTISFGVPGFFKPRLMPPFAQPSGSLEALSFYDTSELKRTLERLVDFDRINAAKIRLSVGAVNVATGNFCYFDNAKMRLEPEHIMASGALPPGLPPILIDGEYYWDGGLVSNTPLQYVIDQDGPDSLLAFQVDLFSARGPMPRTLLEAAEREKDIRYSSRTRLNTDVLKRREAIGAAAKRLAQKIPQSLMDDPDLALLTAQTNVPEMTIMHLIYKTKHDDTFSKDYEFSRTSVEAHWASGRADVEASLRHPDWQNRKPTPPGTVQVFDLNGRASEKIEPVKGGA
jgi:NTE family protein